MEMTGVTGRYMTAGFELCRNLRPLESFPSLLFLFFLFNKYLFTNRTNMMTMDSHRGHTLSPAPPAQKPPAAQKPAMKMAAGAVAVVVQQ